MIAIFGHVMNTPDDGMPDFFINGKIKTRSTFVR